MSAPAAEASSEKPKSKKNLVIILAVVGALVLGGGGFAAYKVLGHHGAEAEQADAPKAKKKAHAEEDADAGEEEDFPAGKPPVFAPLDLFTVNLADGDHYLQVEVKVKVKEAKAAEELKPYMPGIQHDVLLLLSSKTAEDLRTTEGKEATANEIKKLIAKQIHSGSLVKQVVFTKFVLQ